jgi:hypothetical protein
MKKNEKARLAVWVFLCANKGKWFTSKQINDFFIEHNVISHGGLSHSSLSRLLTPGYLQQKGIKRERPNSTGAWKYAVI